ncbi:hypothetical protein KSP39_PZI018531 [Platanthera zijinensis]|uniref:Uncharacterized protein n=1 Tax=Platanthera zijinensis TaxID=2320716 RepID=A0AAP0B3K5_9ASPA
MRRGVGVAVEAREQKYRAIDGNEEWTHENCGGEERSAILLRKSLIQKITNKISSPNHNAEDYSSRTVDKNLARSHTNPAKDLHLSDQFYKDDPGLTRDGPLDPTISTKETVNAVSSMFKVAQVPETISRGLNQFENACHHGLVDPTVNLKQAMDDINGMFGKPLNFVRTRKSKKEDKGSGRKPNVRNQAFFILADEDSEKDVKAQAPPHVSRSSMGEGDFFEPTIFTKEAMNEINDLFGKPLDF